MHDVVLNKMTKHLIAFCLAMLMLGCSRAAPRLLTLPTAPDTPAYSDPDSRTREIVIDRRGSLWFGGKVVDVTELRAQLDSLVKRYGSHPVTVSADAQLPFQAMWDVVDIIVKGGVERPGITAYRSKDTGTRSIGFLARPPNENSEDLISIMGHGNEYILNGRSLALPALDKILSRISSFSRNVTVIIIPANNQTVQQVVDILNICEREGLTKRHLLRRSRELPDLDDAQQTSGADN
jgi:biopolymer transport protein ExbD